MKKTFEKGYTPNWTEEVFNSFSQDYYEIDQLLTSGSFLDPITYKKLFLIFYFDVSKQSEKFNQSVVDATIRMGFGRSGMPKKCIAYALIISDRRFVFKSNGGKMNIESYTSTK